MQASLSPMVLHQEASQPFGGGFEAALALPAATLALAAALEGAA